VRYAMRSLPGWASRAVAAAALAGLAACASSPDTRFYLLTPIETAERPAEAFAGRPPAIGLRPIGLPEHLDREEIVTRVGENRFHLAELDRWAAPLRDNLARVLAEDLTALVPAERVLLFPWRKDGSVEFEVSVEVTRLEGALGGACSLGADWALFRKGAREPILTGRSSHHEPAGESYAALVAAHSRLIARLARDIAAALKALPRPG